DSVQRDRRGFRGSESFSSGVRGSRLACPAGMNPLVCLPLRKAASARRTTVCLLSFHPLLLSEFQRLLTGENEARVVDRRVEANQVPDPTFSVPRASVYVVEAHTHRQVTEAYVGAILARYPKARLVVISEK